MNVQTKNQVLAGLLKLMQSTSNAVINAAAQRPVQNQIKPWNCGKCPSGKGLVKK